MARVAAAVAAPAMPAGPIITLTLHYEPAGGSVLTFQRAVFEDFEIGTFLRIFKRVSRFDHYQIFKDKVKLDYDDPSMSLASCGLRDGDELTIREVGPPRRPLPKLPPPAETPKKFVKPVMLYINCKVNGYPVKAFVNPGAPMTSMSLDCAHRCCMISVMDWRWSGIASGVGTQVIHGRVHQLIQVEGAFLSCPLSIMDTHPMDMLLGLDMLRRHQCSIDLTNNVLVIGTAGSQTPFLPEGELPECARLPSWARTPETLMHVLWVCCRWKG